MHGCIGRCVTSIETRARAEFAPVIQALIHPVCDLDHTVIGVATVIVSGHRYSVPKKLIAIDQQGLSALG
jgi:hypothetical protein